MGRGKLVIAPNMDSTDDFLSRYYALLVQSEIQPCATFPCRGQALCVFEDKEAKTWDKCEPLEDIPIWHPPDETKLAEGLRELHDNYAWHQQYAAFGKHSAFTHFSSSSLSKTAIYEMYKAWKRKNRKGTQKDTSLSKWETDEEFASSLNKFVRDHGLQDFSTLDYI